MIKRYALIVAGGSGSRMGSEMPKQFIELHGKPILMYTITAFYQADPSISIIIVLPQEQINKWDELCLKHRFSIHHKVVSGGKTRGESVLNGLDTIPDKSIVAIHDGVRPFISPKTILDSYEVAVIKGSAVATVDLKDSIREVSETDSKAVDRSNFKIVQTPQTFKTSIIKSAYQEVNSFFLTDDATVAEKAGNKIYLIEGSYDNIKITTPEDLNVAEKIAERIKL